MYLHRLWLGLALGLVLLLAVYVDDCEAAKKKKKKKPKPVEEAKPDDDDGDTKSAKKGKPDWKKMTKADWDRLEQEAEGPGEPWKPPGCALTREGRPSSLSISESLNLASLSILHACPAMQHQHARSTRPCFCLGDVGRQGVLRARLCVCSGVAQPSSCAGRLPCASCMHADAGGAHGMGTAMVQSRPTWISTPRTRRNTSRRRRRASPP
eukprot:Tamp_10406.p1 GENE.Tamp_10406~~Tamp_10406.p1  ORF type:complete len:210 (+),score=34.39 Tamp_10406:256-885(+)